MEPNILMNILESFLEDTDNYSSKIVDIENYFEEYIKNSDPSSTNRFIVDDSKVENSAPNNDINHMQQVVFKMSWRIILESFSRGKFESRAQALRTACSMLKMESVLRTTTDTSNFYFPTHMLQDILSQLLSMEQNNCHLIARFQEYTSYNDVLFYCWRVLPHITSVQRLSDIYINNYFNLINAMPLKKEKKNSKQDEDDKPLIYCDSQTVRFRFDLTKVRKHMEECWRRVTKWKLKGNNLQRAILILIDHLIPHLPRPVLLTDFLMDSMDEGGTISALALQGVFVLMQKHNLEYPLVYHKLYNMYEPEMFFSRHKSRLFYLTDTFLSSTHLPESLVAGFVKKFARLALIVPPVDASVLLHMIANLIIRHPGLGKMLNAKSDTVSEFAKDPFNLEENNPSLSGAIDSSLWELLDLKHHSHPVVAAAASYAMTSHRATMEKPINELLDDTEDDLIEAEFNKKYKQVYLTTKQPDSIADSSDDKLSNYWQLF